ncbi:ankyrin repeat-containing domain protein [Xylaria sp. FL1777]|nr:ankyrin repeat-containing domain protein [Xylaria sp. FL1777]
MDPFSTAASALQIAAFAGSLLKCIARFVEQTRNIADSINELYDEVLHLEAALHDIGETFSKRPQQLPFEYRHHDRIHRILQSCHNSLGDLEQALPQLKDETISFQKLRLSIQRSLKEERLKEIVRHITSYTRILQLSLSTLSLGELWINRQSQEMILAEVRKVTQAIRATKIFSGRTETKIRNPRELLVTSTPQAHMYLADEEARSVLDKEIREWRETVDEIAAAVSLSIPDDESINGRLNISVHNSSSDITLQTFDEDGSDSEQDELDEVSCKVLKLTLENNQKIVRQLMQSEIYFQAAEYQRRGIKKRKLLDDGLSKQDKQDGDASSTSRLIDMEEKLADILFHCDTAQTDKEAKKVLEELLDHETERTETDDTDDTDRQWRLCHKLGNLYVRQGNFRRSRKFLRRAFMGRSKANPRRKSLIIETAEILIKSLQALQRIDEARGIQSWLEEELPDEHHVDNGTSSQLPPRATACEDGDLSSPYRWSMEQGFDVHSPHFGFAVCDPQTGNAPIHLAIQHENLEVLQSMLLSIPQVEQRDSSGSTPMHLAASTRNKRVCAVLMDKAANVDVLDQKYRTPLHRCQGRSGGVQVAELILNRCPDLIDCIDYFGKTALYMACESGNEMMAAYLLSQGAKPNRDGPGKFVPLVSAIDAVAQSRGATIHLIKLLLEHGADVGLRDGNGRTALDAANNAGLAASEIKKRK